MENKFLAIPSELRALNNWILWKYEDVGAKKPTKKPYGIKGDLASVTNPSTWASFEECCGILNSSNYNGLGFVFTDTPYSGIDLDDARFKSDGSPNPTYTADYARQLKIYNEFNSYSERSPSGNGCHIIVKGKVPDGKKLAHIELYPSGRFFTFTGDVINDVPIAAREELLISLYEQMGGSKTIAPEIDAPSTIADQELINLALAHNTATFEPLLNGAWQGTGKYPTQSEADQAFMNIIAYYTDNREQCARIFRNSKLFRADKNKGYIPRTIKKAFDQKLPSVDFQGMNEAYKKITDANVSDTDVAVISAPGHTITPPSGLLGEIARFIYDAAPRQVPEIALAAAIGLMAGVCGRAYNISGTGLNQYVLLIAATGRGKEAMASGISKLMKAVSMSVPVAPEFQGPSEIASGQALIKYLANKSQSFVSILGEFGIRLQVLSHPNANAADKTLRRILLDLYNKSGATNEVRPSIYADQDKNTLSISAPAFSILAESTPETLYSALSEEMITDGLLPRFTLIEYKGPRVPTNDGHSKVQPSFALVEKLAQLMANAKTVMANRAVTDIGETPEATVLLRAFDKLADQKINGTDKDAIQQLWNRAHIKVLRIAGLIAVGNNYVTPVVDVADVQWAINMVEHDITALSNKFEAGEIGSNSSEIKQSIEMTRILKEYATKDFSYVIKYHAVENQHKERIINNSYISLRLSKMAAFRTDRMGANFALKRTIQSMIDNGKLIPVTGEALVKLKTTGKVYYINSTILET